MMVTADSDEVLEDITRVIVERFAPERVMLFGSRARGHAHLDSDYDILVVMDAADSLRPLYAAIADRRYPIDFVVTAVADFERRRDDVGTLEFVVEREGRVLYDRRPERWVSCVREPRRGPPRSLREWLDRAESDYALIDAGLAAAPTAREAICYLAHQGAEKMFKAALVALDVPPPHTHRLADLLTRCPGALRTNASIVSACTLLDELLPAARYPHARKPNAGEMFRAVDAARRVRDAVLVTIRRA